jgi:hypothetical protein
VISGRRREGAGIGRKPTYPAAALGAVLAWALAAQAAPAQIGVGVELVLAVDVSRSMDYGEQTIQRRGYADAFRSAEVQDAILQGGWGRVAITYVEWAGVGSQTVLVPWTLIDSRAAAEGFAARIRAAPLSSRSRTSISAAIRFSAGLFVGNGYRGLRRVIDLSGDGPNNDGGPVTAARDAAVARHITINGLPLMTNDDSIGVPFGMWGSIPHLDRYYAACVIGGPGAFSVPVTRWDQFAAAVRRKLVLELAGRQPPGRGVLVPVQASTPVDCLAGERAWQHRWQGGN